MRVAIVSKALVRGVYQRGLEELAQSGEIDLTLITPPGWREGHTMTMLERRYTRNYRIVEAQIVLNGHYHLYFYPGLGRILAAIRPDVVHFDEEPYNLATFQGLWLARSVGARRLFYAWQNIHRALPLPFTALERANFYLANAAICATEDGAKVLLTKGFRRPITIIPPGLDPDLYLPREPTSGNEFLIGFVGRLVREKGVDLLIRACSTLGSAWRLRIIGDGEQAASLQCLAADLGLSAQVEFHGVVPSSDVPKILQGLDTLVLPSRSLPNWREQIGRVLMEAMACGVPVVGSTCGEIPRVIGDGGLIFPEGDVAALASRLQQLKDDRELRYELGRLGRHRVMSRYTYRQISHDTTEVYRSLISAST